VAEIVDERRSSEGRLRTHSPVRWRLVRVWPCRVGPSTTVQPSAQTADSGARFGVPSGLQVLMSTTGQGLLG
jgi:hypothetical protein